MLLKIPQRYSNSVRQGNDSHPHDLLQQENIALMDNWSMIALTECKWLLLKLCQDLGVSPANKALHFAFQKQRLSMNGNAFQV